jgi:hypothetical protein
LDIDFSLVVIKHLLNKEQEGYNFKLILMSATFNIELFANYFSRSSVKEIEALKVYVGIEEKLKQEEEEKQRKLAETWGPKKADQDWALAGKKALGDQKMEEGQPEDEEDQWVDNAALLKKNVMPIEKRNDPADVIEINSRLFNVEEMYIDNLVTNLLSDPDISKSA